jgi:SAM-dependent methyltransferase
MSDLKHNNMPPAPDALQAYYAERAPYYDAVYLKPERYKDIAFLATHLPERLRGRSILELACGTGYWTQHIAPAAKSLMATDAIAEPLSFARLRPGTDGVIFQQIDAFALPRTLGRFSGAFAGLWFSHVPIQVRHSFLLGLHAILEPGARVLLLDNNEAQLNDFPITDTDANGNTYQHRQLRDGSTHRVLKNFPLEDELGTLLAPMARNLAYHQLENFWLLEYEIPDVA